MTTPPWWMEKVMVYHSVSGANPDGLCFYCGVWVDEVWYDICGVRQETG